MGKTNFIRTTKQLFKEFWVQILISIFWGIYKVHISDKKDDELSVFITNFSASLFLLSWMFGQVIRIKKQQKIDDEFSHVKNELEGLVSKLNQQTEDIIGFATGKKSKPYFMPVLEYENSQEISVHFANNSKYPVYDVIGHYLDLDELRKANILKKHPFELGNIFPLQVIRNVFVLPMQGKDRIHIEIRFNTRAEFCIQEVLAIRANDKIHIAFKVHSNNKTTTNIPSDFPEYDSENPESIFLNYKL